MASRFGSGASAHQASQRNSCLVATESRLVWCTSRDDRDLVCHAILSFHFLFFIGRCKTHGHLATRVCITLNVLLRNSDPDNLFPSLFRLLLQVG